MTWWQALAYLVAGVFVIGTAVEVDRALNSWQPEDRGLLWWTMLACVAVFWPLVLAVILLGLGVGAVSRLVRRWL